MEPLKDRDLPPADKMSLYEDDDNSYDSGYSCSSMPPSGLEEGLNKEHFKTLEKQRNEQKRQRRVFVRTIPNHVLNDKHQQDVRNQQALGLGNQFSGNQGKIIGKSIEFRGRNQEQDISVRDRSTCYFLEEENTESSSLKTNLPLFGELMDYNISPETEQEDCSSKMFILHRKSGFSTKSHGWVQIPREKLPHFDDIFPYMYKSSNPQTKKDDYLSVDNCLQTAKTDYSSGLSRNQTEHLCLSMDDNRSLQKDENISGYSGSHRTQDMHKGSVSYQSCKPSDSSTSSIEFGVKISRNRNHNEGKTLWAECIDEKDVDIANMLIQQETFPSNCELIRAFHLFGKDSETFHNLCNMIYTYIKNRSNSVLDTWASYRFKDYDEHGKVVIVFVVLTKDNLVNIDVHDYNTYFRCVTNFSKESEIVLENEMSDATSNIPNEQEVLKQLRKSISNNADALMKKHSNISVISPSFKRSVGYSSAQHLILDEPCITVYVPIKGFIPIQETPLPKKIDGYYVDVLEGKFVPFTGRPNDFHQKLKMGLAIHANIDDSNGGVLGGTLGGFIDHPEYGLCGITCAHVVSTRDELLGKGTCYCPSDRHVFQPVSGESKMFGEVVCIIKHEGGELTPGMEVAVIKIHERHPENGSFPVAFNYNDTGFDDDNPLTYDSGEVREESTIKRRTEVFKFGMASGITRGSFGLQGSVFRKEEMKDNRNSFGFCLKNQMLILKIGDNPFADIGDSGALVLIEGDENDSVAIGLVEGGMNGKVFVTPICDVLRELKCTPIRMKQFSTYCKDHRLLESVSKDSGVLLDEQMEVSYT